MVDIFLIDIGSSASFHNWLDGGGDLLPEHDGYGHPVDFKSNGVPAGGDWHEIIAAAPVNSEGPIDQYKASGADAFRDFLISDGLARGESGVLGVEGEPASIPAEYVDNRTAGNSTNDLSTAYAEQSADTFGLGFSALYSGNTGSATLNFTLDRTAPAVSVALASDTGISATDRITSNPAIKGTGQANTAVTIKEGGTTLGTTTAGGTGAWSFTPAGLADGAHALSATQTDQAGNTGSATLNFTLDRTAPVVSVALASDTGISATDRITSNPAIKGTGQANTAVTIKEGGTTLGTTTAGGTGVWSFTPAGLADGAHALSATQTDQAGNTGSATLNFTLDRTAPVVSVALASDTGISATDRITSNPAIKGTGQANTAVTIKEGGTTLGTTTAGGTGAWSFTPAGLADGAHALSATQTDQAGNTGSATLNFTLDQDRAGGKRGSGIGYRYLRDGPDHIEPGDKGHRPGPIPR